MRGRCTQLALALIAAAGCSADRPETGMKTDAAVAATLDPPSLDPDIPTSTPRSTVAVRGTTGGARVLVEGGPGAPILASPLPSGSFCVDAPLNTSGATSLTAFALKNGEVSAPVTLSVTQDPAAPIPSMPTCSGQEMPVCTTENTGAGNCNDGLDNNCDGFIDACDTGCNGCTDDAFSPNWQPFFVPMVAAGTYNLQICPCRNDWFAFTVNQGDIVHVKASFDTTMIDLDIMLQKASDAEANNTTNVAISAGTTNTEEINWTATAAGVYYLKVYPYSGKDAAYKLIVY